MMLAARNSASKLMPVARMVVSRAMATEAQNRVFVASQQHHAMEVAIEASHVNNNNVTAAVMAAAFVTGVALGGGITLMEAPPPTTKVQHKPTKMEQIMKDNHPQTIEGVAEANHPPFRPDLPTYTAEQVGEHCDEESMWYSFRGAVYDMTFFLQGHPGGAPRLLMSAGQDLEPFWDVYRQHFRGHVIEWMEKYRIGNLAKEDAIKAKEGKFGDMFETDPKRHPDLLPATSKPFNGEPRIDLLVKDYITPNELFYTRNHLAVPDICPEDYRLIVSGKGVKKRIFKLEDLKKFPKHEVITTLQCAGNRREDLHDKDHKIFISPHWVIGAMSTAKWGGVKLRDVLRECGMDVDAIALGEKMPEGGVKHLQLEGYDQDETGYTYGGSFPIEKAVDGLGEVILAYEMNGEQLPRDHGYPVRMLIPGHVGARQVKWLHKIRLSNEPSKKSYQCKSYRGFAPDITFQEDLADWSKAPLHQGPIIHEQPVTSFVCDPPQNSTIGAKGATDITFKGVSWSGGGRKIERVDVSVDGGKTWTAADLYKPIDQRYNHHWAWTQFSHTLPLPDDVQEKLRNGETAEMDIVSKAMDSGFNVQPETMAPYWNPRGIAINHWYHVKIKLDPNMTKGKIIRSEPELGFPNTPSGGKFDRPWGYGGWTLDPEHQTGPFKLHEVETK